MMSGDGSLATGLIDGTGQQNAQGTLISCGCLIDAEGKTNPKAKKFADDYKAKFGSEVAIYSTEGFDAATAFIEAVKAGQDRARGHQQLPEDRRRPGCRQADQVRRQR